VPLKTIIITEPPACGLKEWDEMILKELFARKLTVILKA
jgi:hypothetical protein